jgi:hypothetical protein
MSTQRLLRLPAGVSLCDAGTNSRYHCRISTRFLHAASVFSRISPSLIFLPHRYGRRIYHPNRRASHYLSVQIPITPRHR